MNIWVFVLHPAFYWRYNYEFTYDHNPRCKAYIPMGLGRDYVCGGINGGDRDAYLKFCHTLQKAYPAGQRQGSLHCGTMSLTSTGMRLPIRITACWTRAFAFSRDGIR